MATSTFDPRARTFAICLLAVLAVWFLVSAWPRVTAPFGDSDEGINGAVWGQSSRSLRTLGPVASRLGGLRADGTKYANHPPLIGVETALVESVVGEHPWSTRAPAWIGALASIALLYALLRSIGVSPVVASASTFAALASHMFSVYGTMLDTMVTGFPIGLALLLVWHRHWIGHRAPPWAAALLAFAAALAGWQAAFLAGLCGVAFLTRLGHDRRAWRAAVPYLTGAAAGGLATIGWAQWVYGGLGPLSEKLGRRAGGGAAPSIGEMVGFQLPWLAQLLGLGLFAWIGCALAVRDPRFRAPAIVSLAAVVGYALVLREGSGGHQYWNYWGLLPAAMGFAYLIDLLANGASRSAPARGGTSATVMGVALGVALVAGAVGVTRPNQAAELIERGIVTYELVAAARLPDGQSELPYVGEAYRPDDWLRYRGGPPGRPLLSEGQLRELARDHPDHVVLVLGSCADPDPTAFCSKATNGGERSTSGDALPTLVTAADLERRLP